MTNCIKPPGRVVTDDGLKDVPCKMRNCPVCSRVLRNQLMNRVTKFFADDTLRFMTVTMQADDKSSIMDHWHVLLVDIKRHYPRVRGFWVKEFTKRGVRHLHVLVTRYVDQAWLQRRWHEITRTSWNIKIKKVDDSFEVKNAAAYMLKYMTKAHNHLELFDKGERIYGFFGARAPPKELLGFEKPSCEFILDQHYNPSSKYWSDYITPLTHKGWKDWEHPGWYNIMQRKYGPPFIDYMERMTTKHKGITSTL